MKCSNCKQDRLDLIDVKHVHDHGVIEVKLVCFLCVCKMGKELEKDSK